MFFEFSKIKCRKLPVIEYVQYFSSEMQKYFLSLDDCSTQSPLHDPEQQSSCPAPTTHTPPPSLTKFIITSSSQSSPDSFPHCLSSLPSPHWSEGLGWAGLGKVVGGQRSVTAPPRPAGSIILCLPHHLCFHSVFLFPSQSLLIWASVHFYSHLLSLSLSTSFHRGASLSPGGLWSSSLCSLHVCIRSIFLNI